MSTQCFISCHPYRIIRKKIWPCHKNGQGQPRIIIWKKPQGMGIQPLGTRSGSILKLLLFPSFLTSSRKILFASLFYVIFVCFFIHVYIAPGQEETTLGDYFFFFFFLMEAERSYHFDHWLYVSKNNCSLILCTLFCVLIHVYSPWAGENNPLGPNFLCQQEGLITLIICCKFQNNFFNHWLYTHLFII